MSESIKQIIKIIISMSRKTFYKTNNMTKINYRAFGKFPSDSRIHLPIE